MSISIGDARRYRDTLCTVHHCVILSLHKQAHSSKREEHYDIAIASLKFFWPWPGAVLSLTGKDQSRFGKENIMNEYQG